VNAVIISVGTELLTGQCVDTNSAWLSAALSETGVCVRRHVTVGDEIEPISDAIRESLHECDVVIVTGGLGPTADDLSREALARAIGRPLRENANALRQIESFFAGRRRAMPATNRLQALIPEGCAVLRNENGTAPGIHYADGGRHVFALPGVPNEMKRMFEQSIIPIVAASAGLQATVMGRLSCFGMSEAVIGEHIVDLMDRSRNPLVGTTASDAVISVRIVARGDDAAQARRLLADDMTEIRRRLGDAVFGEGDETLQTAVARILTAARKTLATAESCTGGLLAKRLTDVPGSSEFFLRGYVAYSNQSKVELLGVDRELLAREGAVSESVARAMAVGCHSASAADVALSITGVAGPTGGSPPDKPVGLVYVALADANETIVKRLLLGEQLSRPEIRDRSAKSALDLLRRHMSSAPIHS